MMAKHRSPKRLLILGFVALITIVTVVVFNPLSALDSDEEDEITPTREQAEISATALSRAIETDGQLVPVEQRTVSTTGSGTVTDVADPGNDIVASSPLFEIDDVPTLALIGDTPAWRTMTVGDVGPDVEQLETNLASLGYDLTGELTVDDTYTDYTAVLVERWQTDVGLDPSGSVPFGSVEFVPADAKVSSVLAVIGDTLTSNSTPIMIVSSSAQELAFTIAPQDLDNIEAGTEVSARLPDRTTVSAVVDQTRSTGDDTWTASATLTRSDDDVSLPDGEIIPVVVSWIETLSEETTTVQASALTRLDAGAYVIEVVEDNTTRFVEVDIGAAAGSTVEIITDLPPGTPIITP